MTYDQAQSPRLGQRVAVESTYVQIFDVTPGGSAPELPISAYPGQLIFRNDLGILQIWDEQADTWLDVAGGIAGAHTYVGPEQPTGGDFNLGDTWYDSDDEYQAWVWDGTTWVQTAGGGVTTYHQDGWVGDPRVRVGPTGAKIGDIWYQTDDFNHVFRWDGHIWVDVKDGNIAINAGSASDNLALIGNIGAQVQELTFLATSANNTADTADGRVSMSDYNPGKDDVLYEQSYQHLVHSDPDDPASPLVEETVYYMTPRQNGSIWFTRTRPRKNLCTNPSFEANQAEWTGTNTTILREIADYVPAGVYTLRVTNDASANDHIVSWGVSTPAPCEEGKYFSASQYAELISGTGTGVYMTIRWYDVSGVLISTSFGDPMDLTQDAFDPSTLNTMAEPRLWVKGIAPAGAVSLSTRIISPAGNVNDVWHTGALLIEQQDDLGRYFDGDSYDGQWEGVRHNSVSHLNGHRIVKLWELRDGFWIDKQLTDDTIFSLNAAKLFGQTSGSIIAEGTMNPSSLSCITAVASENLAAGDIVGFWNAAGDARVRKACAAISGRQEAHGYVLHAVTAGQLATVYHTGWNALQSSLTPGNQWLSLAAGKVSSSPPSSIGALVQRLGHAPAPTVLNFACDPAIWVV